MNFGSYRAHCVSDLKPVRKTQAMKRSFENG